MIFDNEPKVSQSTRRLFDILHEEIIYIVYLQFLQTLGL